MPRRSSTDSCGNTLRTVNQATSQSGSVYVNKSIQQASDGSVDYSAGQPLYQGDARCDPARLGAVDPPCCK